MAPVNGCVLAKAKNVTACDVCKVDETSVSACVLAAVTVQEAQGLVVPPIGGPKFVKVRMRLQQPVVQNAADHMASLLELLKP